MATPALATDGSFPVPPRSFEDGTGRTVVLEATDDAADALATMYADFAETDRSQGLPPRDETRVEEWVRGLLDDGINVVARHDDRVVGHGVLVPFDGMAELAIFVHPDYQQVGVGSRLIRALLGEGERAGVGTVWLCVERANTVAVNLYRSVGFERTVDGMEIEMELPLAGTPAEDDGS